MQTLYFTGKANSIAIRVFKNLHKNTDFDNLITQSLKIITRACDFPNDFIRRARKRKDELHLDFQTSSPRNAKRNA